MSSPCNPSSKKNTDGTFQPPPDVTLNDLVESYLHEKKMIRGKSITYSEFLVHELDRYEDLTAYICGENNPEQKVPNGTNYKLNSHQRQPLNCRWEEINKFGETFADIHERKFRDFEEMMDYVDDPIRDVKQFGDTCKYDFALRHGWHRNPRIEPEEYVYLHAKPLKAAKALFAKGYLDKVVRRMRFDSFPEELRQEGMTAKDVENFLCIFKEKIEQLHNKR